MSRSERRRGESPVEQDDADMSDLFDDLSELEDLVDSPAERARVREAMQTASEVDDDGPVFGRVVWGFDRADLAESVLGALLFGIPMAVEGGTVDSGRFIAARPPFLALTLLATVAVVVGILYVADIQDVRVAYAFFGLVPRRLVGVLGSSFVTAVTLLSVWGVVDWADPWLDFCVCVVAFFPMAIGAALGDILPGS
ncbi:DUF2391 domain-containing protein [Halomicrobium sp. HM KBTZ05]|uniref:DUF2391 domain-containing protein n=1 Tax=Halomicrobium sp. HM KBTZ05 TaxID=3242663 RepID=UPI003556104A